MQLMRFCSTASFVFLSFLIPLTAIAETPDLDKLANMAAKTGWQTARDKDGSLLLYPSGTEKIDPDLIPSSRTDLLEQRLTSAGWQVRRDQDGNLLAYPKQVRQSSANKQQPAQVKAVMTALQQALNTCGWKSHRDKTGNLLLYPQNTQIEYQSLQKSQRYQKNQNLTQQEKFRQRGWLSQYDINGNLLLYPTRNT